MEPGWGTTPETVPLTPDEERADSHYRETAQSQISAMNALGIAISNGLQIPPEMMYLLRKQLPADMIIPGTKVCAGGHDAPAGSQFCPECGVSMAARASSPVAQCSRCSESVCDRHVDMIGGEWVCSRCQRAARKASQR
jgi:ribosomal protein S27AE